MIARRLWLYVAQDDAFVAEQLRVSRATIARLRSTAGWSNELPQAQEARKAFDAEFANEVREQGRQVNQRALRAALAYLEFHETASGKLSAGSVADTEKGILATLRSVPGLKEAAEIGRLVTGQTTNQTGIESDMAAQVAALRKVLRGEDPGSDGGSPVDGLPPPQPASPDPSQP